MQAADSSSGQEAESARETYTDQGCTITYTENSTWGNYVHAEVTIENQTSQDKSLWQLDIRYGGQIDNIWNADIILAEKGSWRIAAKSYNSTIPAGGSVSFGFLAYGEQEKPQKPSRISFVRKEAPTPSMALPAGGDSVK